MAKNKTQETGIPVRDFLDRLVPQGTKRSDADHLIEIMEQVSGEKPYMWGPSIIAFGKYKYRYASGHQGSAPLIGFSPRKTAFALYVFTGKEEHQSLLDGLGTFTRGKACLYVKRLEDIDLKKLSTVMRATIAFLKATYPAS